MLGDAFLIGWIVFLGAYLWAVKFRYDDVLEEYVKVKMMFSKSRFLSSLMSFLG